MSDLTIREQIEAQLRRRILVMDGAMGTMVQRHGLGETDFRGCLLYTSPSPRD